MRYVGSLFWLAGCAALGAAVVGRAVLRPASERRYTLTGLTATSSVSSGVATFRAIEDGKPAPWEPVEIRITDGIGKRWRSGSLGVVEHVGDTLRVPFTLHASDWPPWSRPDPKSWILRAEFVQTGGFAARNLWTVRGFSLSHGVARQTRLNGASLTLHPLIPPGEPYAYSMTWGPRESNYPLIQVEVTNPKEGVRLRLVSARDDRGRTVRTSLYEEGERSSDVTVQGEALPWDTYFALTDLAPDAKSVDLTFACIQSDFVTLTATPEVHP